MSNQNHDELVAELQRLQEENNELRSKQPKPPGLTLKVGEKGGICVYGLALRPVSLYRSQMERLLDHADKIREFIAANESKLAVKATK